MIGLYKSYIFVPIIINLKKHIKIWSTHVCEFFLIFCFSKYNKANYYNIVLINIICFYLSILIIIYKIF